MIFFKSYSFLPTNSADEPDYEGASAIIGFVVDVSAERDLRRQLVEAQKMEAIGTLAGGIAHDFNNILSAIIGYAELAKMKVGEESRLINDLNQILKAGNRAKDLIMQILTVSRHTEEERKAIAPATIVKEAMKLLRASVPTSIEFNLEIDKDAGMILADATRIHQILMNLCTNAQHAMSEGDGALTVRLGNVEVDSKTARHLGVDPGAYVKLTVSDTGCGMTPDVLERIFEPYFTTKEKGEGTGLGLSVVHGIVESYGGKIRVYSEQGKGTAFHVYFPKIDTASKEADRSEAPIVIPTGTERILFVDDEPPVVEMAKEMLDQLGYEVTALTDSVKALELVAEDPDRFVLVITDLTMPGMTGDRLTSELLNIRPKLPVIVCSGFIEKPIRKKVRRAGAKAFIEKPFTSEKLARTVREVLDQGIGD
jgi:nitrogen-specific signal transduction histidine kinase